MHCPLIVNKQVNRDVFVDKHSDKELSTNNLFCFILLFLFLINIYSLYSLIDKYIF